MSDPSPNIMQAAKSLGAMLVAPIRIRRNPPHPPVGTHHFEVPRLAATADAATMKAAAVPPVRTPPGRWKDWPPMVLAECDEPLVEGAPDLRGVWQVYKGPMKGHIERNEQSGCRVVVTAAGVVHDLSADGSVMRDEGIGGADLSVTIRYEDRRLNFYLNNKRRVVTRYRDGDDLVWRWGPYTNRLRRLSGPGDAH